MWNAKVIAIHMEDSARDFRPDLKKLDVPTLFIHGFNAHRAGRGSPRGLLIA